MVMCAPLCTQHVPLKVRCALNVVQHVPQHVVNHSQVCALNDVWQDVNVPVVLSFMRWKTNVSMLTSAVRRYITMYHCNIIIVLLFSLSTNLFS